MSLTISRNIFRKIGIYCSLVIAYIIQLYVQNVIFYEKCGSKETVFQTIENNNNKKKKTQQTRPKDLLLEVSRKICFETRTVCSKNCHIEAVLH